MAAKQLVQAQIDGAIKAQAEVVLATLGLTVSDAVRLMLTRVACDGVFPFDPLMPNAVTIVAMMQAHAGDTVKVGNITELMVDLHADENSEAPCSSVEPDAARQMALARQLMDDDSDILRALAKS